MKESDRIKVRGDDYYNSNETISVNLDNILSRYHITKRELNYVRKHLAPLVEDQIDNMITMFYTWLKKLPEYQQFFADNDTLLKRVQSSQKIYWLEMLHSDIDQKFVDKRLRLARTHSRISLPLDSYYAGVAFFNNWIIHKGLSSVEKSDVKQKDTMTKAIAGFIKIIQIDQAIVVEEYVRKSNFEKNELIQRQADTISKLATPIAILAENILLVTIIGLIDSKRAMEMLETTLTKVLETAAKVAIIDISGVDMVDTAVANYLVKMFQAINLMGCKCMISGVSPGIAQTIVQLGIDLSGITTKAALRDAVEAAYHIVNE